MNERINELLKQARDYINEVSDADGVYQDKEYPQAVREKFAKLIVGECADYIQHFYGDIAASSIGNDIKLHFGIEE